MTLCCAERLRLPVERLAEMLRGLGHTVKLAAGARARTALLRAAPSDALHLVVVCVPSEQEEAAMQRLRDGFPRPGWGARQVAFAIIDGKQPLEQQATRIDAWADEILRSVDLPRSSTSMASPSDTLLRARLHPREMIESAMTRPGNRLEARSGSIELPTCSALELERIEADDLRDLKAPLVAFFISASLAFAASVGWLGRADSTPAPAPSVSVQSTASSDAGDVELPPVPGPLPRRANPTTAFGPD